MPLRITCPTGHSLIVSEDRAGRTLRCPRCDHSVVVPHVQKPLVPAEAVSKPVMAKVAAPEAEQTLPSAPPETLVEPPPVAPSIEPPPVSLSAEPPPVASIEEPPPIAPPPVAEEVVRPPPIEPLPQAPFPVAADEEVSKSAEPALETVTEPSPAPTEEERESAAFAEIAAPDEPLPPPQQEATPRSQPAPALPGVIHDRSKVLVVYQLAAAVVAAALFGMAPAAWDIAEYWRFPEMHFVARWAFALLFLGVLQLAYAVYVAQLPDWGTVWVVTLYSLGLATLYAMVLGLTLISREDATIVRFLQLEDKIAGSKAALWCICMVSVATLLAFFAGRISVRWHKTEQLLRPM